MIDNDIIRDFPVESSLNDKARINGNYVKYQLKTMYLVIVFGVVSIVNIIINTFISNNKVDEISSITNSALNELVDLSNGSKNILEIDNSEIDKLRRAVDSNSSYIKRSPLSISLQSLASLVALISVISSTSSIRRSKNEVFSVKEAVPIISTENSEKLLITDTDEYAGISYRAKFFGDNHDLVHADIAENRDGKYVLYISLNWDYMASIRGMIYGDTSSANESLDDLLKNVALASKDISKYSIAHGMIVNLSEYILNIAKEHDAVEVVFGEKDAEMSTFTEFERTSARALKILFDKVGKAERAIFR